MDTLHTPFLQADEVVLASLSSHSFLLLYFCRWAIFSDSRFVLPWMLVLLPGPVQGVTTCCRPGSFQTPPRRRAIQSSSPPGFLPSLAIDPDQISLRDPPPTRHSGYMSPSDLWGAMISPFARSGSRVAQPSPTASRSAHMAQSETSPSSNMSASTARPQQGTGLSGEGSSLISRPVDNNATTSSQSTSHAATELDVSSPKSVKPIRLAELMHSASLPPGQAHHCGTSLGTGTTSSDTSIQDRATCSRAERHQAGAAHSRIGRVEDVRPRLARR